MDNQVRYTVTANDMLSGKLQGMQAQAVKLESTMGGLSKIMGTLGIGFAVFKGLEFVKGGIEKVEKLNQATAQVKAGLESTGGAAGMTMESINSMADKMSSRMLFGKADILDMQAQMLTFGGITKENFPAIGDAIANVATKIGMDLHGMAIQFGKAMDNPSDGIKKLSRQGVLFSKEQADAIDKLVEKGKIVEAQQIMLTEIQNKYGGSSKAAFDANPLAVFTKRMGAFQVSIGKVAIEFMEQLVPALNYIADLFKNLGKFMKEHAEIIMYVIGVYVIYKGIILAQIAIEKIGVWWKGVSATATLLLTGYEMARAEGLSILEAAQWALNVAMDANPIGLLIAGTAALIALVAEIVVHFHEWGAAITLIFPPIGMVVSAIMSLYGHWQSIKDAFNSDGIVGGLKRIGIVLLDTLLYPLQQALQLASKIPGLGYLAGEGAKKIMELRKSMNLITTDETEKKQSEKLTKKGLTGVKPIATGIKPIEDKTKGVTGTKNVTINIAIGSLIHDFKINTTNIQESAKAIHDKVTQTLTMAVNDSQIVAGQ